MPSVSDVLKFIPFIGPTMDIGEGFGDVADGNYLKGGFKMATGAGFLLFDCMTFGTLSSAVHGATAGATKMAGKAAAQQLIFTTAEKEVFKHLASRTLAAGVVKGGARVCGHQASNGQNTSSSSTGSRNGDTSNKSGTSSSASAGAPQPPKPPHQKKKEPITVPKLKGKDTKSTTEGEALRKAKEANGIAADAVEYGPTIYVKDHRTNEDLPVYKYKSKDGKYFYIRRDNATRYDDNNPDQPPHFNVKKSKTEDHANMEYDIRKTRKDYFDSVDLGQHHYFPEDF